MKSNLVVSYYIDPFHLLAPIAQLIEHQTCKLEVMSSIPGLAQNSFTFFSFYEKSKKWHCAKKIKFIRFSYETAIFTCEKSIFKWKIIKIKKKKCLSEPRFELGISDPIANHITTRPRSNCWNSGKNFRRLLISNMIYLYGLIQPMAGRNRVNTTFSQNQKYR